MADGQKSQIIDVRKSYLPVDPNAFAQNLVGTERSEDGEEKTIPVTAYEGYNFLPTPYGYRSYFGQNAELSLQPLLSRSQHIIPFRNTTGKTFLIALCEDGIWIADTTIAGASWVQVVTHTYDLNIFEQWTWCFLDNKIYAYKQGYSEVYVNSETITFDVTFGQLIPSFLNMPGQIGIFKAGIRLGFWDSANSISWSSTTNIMDFTPSIETLAGNAIFSNVVGSIVAIKSHAGNFIIYSTGSIIGAVYTIDGTNVWDTKSILGVGILHPRSVTTMSMDYNHYAWTTGGAYRIDQYNKLGGKFPITVTIPEVFDLLKESRLPVFLSCLEDRYLCFEVASDDYLVGRSTAVRLGIDPTRTSVKLAEEFWDGDITLLPTQADGNLGKTILQQLQEANIPGLDLSCLG